MKSKKHLRTASLLVVFFAVVLSFQNCSKLETSHHQQTLDSNGGEQVSLFDSLKSGINFQSTERQSRDAVAFIEVDGQQKIVAVILPLENTSLSAGSPVTAYEGALENLTVTQPQGEYFGFKIKTEKSMASIQCQNICVLRIVMQESYTLAEQPGDSVRIAFDLISAADGFRFEGPVQTTTSAALTGLTVSDDGKGGGGPPPPPNCSVPPYMADRAGWAAWVAACGSP